MNHPLSPIRPSLPAPFRAFPRVLAALASALVLSSSAASLAADEPPVLFSLSGDSAISDKARETWDFWTTAQSDPSLAVEFSLPDSSSGHPSPFVRPTPYLALRLSPSPAFAVPPGAGLSCRFEFFYAPTNALPGLDPDAPAFGKRPPFHTEIVTLPGGLPATVPLPDCTDFLFPAYPRSTFRDVFLLRVTLEAAGGSVPGTVPLARTVLPPFDRFSNSRTLASTDLPRNVWQSASDRYWDSWTPAGYSATVPDAFPARFPHAAVLSAADFAGLADRPVLARRMALSATPVAVHDAPAAAALPADPPLPYNSILFAKAATSVKDMPSLDNDSLDFDDPQSVFFPPPSVRRAHPVYAVWIALAFLLAALLSAVLLARLFRRPPALRTPLWIVLPATALGLALLTLLAGALFLPRTPRADRILVRVGYAGSPEEWCRASTRCFAFRDTDWTFSFPSAQAGIATRGASTLHPPATLVREAASDTATLVFPRGQRAAAVTVRATWFAPADFPLAVEPCPDPTGGSAHEGEFRTITPNRDLDALWVVIGTNRYALGPVAAGTPVHPRPSQLLSTNDILPALPAPFTGRLPWIRGNGCGCPGTDDEEETAPADGATAPGGIVALRSTTAPDGTEIHTVTFANGDTLTLDPGTDLDAYLAQHAFSPPPQNPEPSQKSQPSQTSPAPPPPWITIARVDSIAPGPAGPVLAPETRSTEQTLWITEWP